MLLASETGIMARPIRSLLTYQSNHHTNALLFLLADCYEATYSSQEISSKAPAVSSLHGQILSHKIHTHTT
jgi:hypothetical protein